jgi:amino acid adenylation domain-containing protein/non-ribosomal peptide synthase protein (TIGR01720 family)
VIDAQDTRAALDRVNSSLDLGNGPLFRAAVLPQPNGTQRLLLVAHHLVIDAVSWRILFEDLAAAYEQALRSESVSLPTKSTSYIEWVRHLQRHAQNPELLVERDYWASMLARSYQPLPADFANGREDMASTRRISRKRSSEQTATLISDARRIYKLSTEELLVVCLLRGLRQWRGLTSILLNVEGHGREPFAPTMDVSRTVGWFTTLYPVGFSLSASGYIAEDIEAIKTTLRDVPGEGAGYGLLRYYNDRGNELASSAWLSFNYLGTTQSLAGSGFAVTSEDPGTVAHPANRRAHSLDVNALVLGGELILDFSWSGNRFEHASIEGLAASVNEQLQGLQEHFAQRRHPVFSVSDFPLARLTPAQAKALPPQTEDVYGLAPLQHGLLFYWLTNPESPAYFEQHTIEFEGALDIERLQRAFTAVVSRHPILRSVYRWQEGGSYQVVLKASDPEFIVQDLRDCDPEQQTREVRNFLVFDRRSHFNLATGPLVRMALLRLGNRRCNVVFSHHHIVMDGWSFRLLMDDMMRECRGTPPVRRPPFRNFIAWLASREKSEAVGYWRECLSGMDRGGTMLLPAVTDIGSTPGACSVTLTLAEDLAAAIADRARRARWTLSSALQVAWAALLSRHCRTEDVVFGVTVSGRPSDLSGAGEMLGPLINTVPFRVRIQPNARIDDLVASAQSQIIASSEHANLTPGEIQAASGHYGGDLFNTLFVFENYPVRVDSLPTLEGGPVISSWSAHEMTHYPLTLLIMPKPRLTLRVLHSPVVFSRASVNRLLSHFQQIIASLADTDARMASQLSLASSDERTRIVQFWNATDAVTGSHQNLVQLFEDQAQRTPDATGVRFEGQHLSYAELDREAGQIADLLAANGVDADEPVGICLHRCLELAPVVLGILRAGACCMPLDPTYPQTCLEQTVRIGKPQVILTHSRALAVAERFGGSIRIINVDERNPVPRQADREVPLARWHPDSLAYLLFTSGSTGTPKGIGMTHRALLNLIEWQTRRLPPVRTTLQFAPLNFDVSFQEMFGAWASGSLLIIAASNVRTDLFALAKLLQAARVERLFLPTTALIALAEVCQMLGYPQCGLKDVIVAGEQLQIAPAVASWFAHTRAKLHNHYGPTETHVVTTLELEDEPHTWPALPGIGTPIANTQCYVLDNSLNLLPPEVPGELYIGGVSLARGYHRAAAATAERFIPDPFGSPGNRLYRTGDLVKWTAAGELEFIGRTDDQVKFRGYRVELGEIESILCSHHDVSQSVVVTRSSGSGTAELIAHVKTRDGAAIDTQTLLGFLRGRLPEYMVPATVRFHESFPLTPNGKVDRKILMAYVPDQPRSAWAPQGTSPIEEIAGQVWSHVLGIRLPSVEANFFDLGGHSLSAMRVVTRLSSLLGREISVRVLIENPVLRCFAATLNESQTHLPRIARAAAQEFCDLSPSQRRLWFLTQLHGSETAYNMPFAVRFSGPLDVTVLHCVLQDLVNRHDVFRSAFVSAGNTPRLCVSDSALLSLPVEDVCQPDAESRIAGEITRFAIEPINLETGPVFRAKLFRISPTDHVLAVVIHHIVSDYWSSGIILRECGEMYKGLMRGLPAAEILAPVEIQFTDYAKWQNELIASGALDAQLHYWKRKLSGELPVLVLPSTRVRPAVDSFDGGRVRRTLTSDRSSKLRDLAASSDVTLFMLLVAAFQVMLARLSGQKDVCVGTPVAGRHHPQVENLPGFLVNTVVLRADLSCNHHFSDFLQQVRQTCLDAYANQDYPFDMLVDQLAVKRDLSRTPIFNTTFSLLHSDARAAWTGGDSEITVQSFPFEFPRAKFDLSVTVATAEDGLEMEFEYNSTLFDHDTVARFALLYDNLLAFVVADPRCRILDLEWLDAEQRGQVTRGMNMQVAVIPVADSISQRFQRQALLHPERTSIVALEKRLTYRELRARVAPLAGRLRESGVDRNVPVAVCLERSENLIVAILAILDAGGCYVPVEPAYPEERLAYMVADSGARVGLCDSTTVPALSGLGLEAVISVDVIRPDDDAGLVEAKVLPDDLAYIIYTSGSTGKQKGSLLTHRNLLRLFDACLKRFHFGPGDVWSLFHSICFDFSVWELFGAILHGGTVVVVPEDVRRSPQDFARLLANERVTILSQTPTSFARLLDHAEERGRWAWAESLRYVVSGGEALDYASLRPWFRRQPRPQARLVNMYGITEATVHVTYREVVESDVDGTPWRMIGWPLSDLTAYVLDDAMRPLPVGVAGELFVGGDGLARGYLRLPALTATRFVPDPFGDTPGARLYRTGDRVRGHSSGELEYLGRADQQLKIRGYRVEPGEIEAALAGIEDISFCAVAPARDRSNQMHLVAYYRAGHPLPSSTLRSALAQSLPDYMIPSAFVYMENISMTANGKVDRSKLVYDPRERSETRVPFVAPRTTIQRRLVRLWEQVLDVRRVGLDDNFFDLGGESFCAYRLMAKIGAEFGYDLPLTAIFQAQTPGGLAEVIEKAAALDSERSVVRIQSGGADRLPFFCVHPAGGDILGFQALAKALGREVPFYGVQSAGRIVGSTTQASLEEMAEFYLREVRAIEPEGPYLLGGHSLGAVVAFEMVRQLETEGAKVGLLAVLDGELRIESAMLDTLLLVSDIFELGLSRQELSSVPDSEMMEYLLRKARKKFARVLEIAFDLDILPRGFRTRDAELFLSRIAANIDRAVAYRPEVISAPITLFTASEATPNVAPVDVRKWQAHTRGGVCVIPAPGNHMTLMKPPHVRTLADLLRPRLEEFRVRAAAVHSERWNE